eukprot:12926791-Alexandrium_andersonii.AAC.1
MHHGTVVVRRSARSSMRTGCMGGRPLWARIQRTAHREAAMRGKHGVSVICARRCRVSLLVWGTQEGT